MQTATRTIIHADAIAWLAAQERLVGASVITSLPDIAEVPHLSLDDWRAWFSSAAAEIIAKLEDDAVAIFYQSDIRHSGVWIDKGYLVHAAASASGATLLWHKIVLRRGPGTVTYGRAGYSHMLCYSKALRPKMEHSSADVLESPGVMTWSKAMGVNACIAACKFIVKETTTRTVVDPFCGYGTALAVANAFGLDAIGVDLSQRKCRRARALSLSL